MDRTRPKNCNAKTNSAFLGYTMAGFPIVSQSFKVGFLTVRYYSLFFVAGVVIAYFIAKAKALKKGISETVFDEMIFWTVLFGFISARIYYVLFYFDQYTSNLSEIFKVWHGGLAIYGGLIGGVITLYFLSKKHNVNFFSLTDVIVLGLPLAQAIGRLGNYFNYEAFGKPTDLPWKMFVPANFRPDGFQSSSFFHPTFAYEIVSNLLVFLVLWRISKKTNNPGILTGAYLILYSIGRFFIESIRLDSAFIGIFRVDQLVALLLIFAGLGIIINRYVAQTSK